MFRAFGFALCIVGLSACSGQPQRSASAVVNLDFANTSLGYRNSGALSAGRLMLWDQKANELITLSSDIPIQRGQPTTPVKLEATSVRGATVKASLNLTDKANAQIASKIKNNLSFVITDASRINASKTYNAISQAYSELNADGVNAYRAWRVEDAVTKPSQFKFVLLTDEIIASEESISFDNSISNSASFSVIDEVAGEIDVTIPSKTTAKCSGTKVVCYVNASVLKVFLNANKGLDYQPTSFKSEDLSMALKALP